MYFQHSVLIPQMGSGFSSVFLVDSYDWRRFPTFHLKNRRTFTLFTICIGLPYPVNGNIVELVKKSIDLYAVMYEANRSTKRCIAAILPQCGLFRKRKDRSRESGESWKEARTLQM